MVRVSQSAASSSSARVLHGADDGRQRAADEPGGACADVGARGAEGGQRVAARVTAASRSGRVPALDHDERGGKPGGRGGPLERGVVELCEEPPRRRRGGWKGPSWSA